MADNVELDAGSGGAVVATDEIGGEHFQRVKLIHGADGTDDGDVATGNPLPVDAREIKGVALSVDSGSTDTGTQRVILADDQDSVDVDGNVAHDAADSGNPLKVGYKAIAHGSNPTAVAADDRTDAYANRHGIPWVIGGHPNVVCKGVLVTDANGAQTDTAIVTVSGGTKIVVTGVTITVDDACTVAPSVIVGFGAANVPTPSTAGVAGIVAYHPGIPAGGGKVYGTGAGILGIGADGEDLRYTCEDPTSGNLSIVVSYYTVES